MAEQAKSLPEIVGARIKEERDKHGLSQKALGAAAGVSQTTVWSIEAGETATNLEVLEAIAKQLGVDPSDLLRRPSATATMSWETASSATFSKGPAQESLIAKVVAALPALDDTQLRGLLAYLEGLKKKVGAQKPQAPVRKKAE